jgi:hypothetical protein
LVIKIASEPPLGSGSDGSSECDLKWKTRIGAAILALGKTLTRRQRFAGRSPVTVSRAIRDSIVASLV